MPLIAYIVYLILMVAAVLVSRSEYVMIYLIIGFLLAKGSIDRVTKSPNWKHDKWYAAQAFGYIVVIWPIYLIICLSMYLDSKKE